MFISEYRDLSQCSGDKQGSLSYYHQFNHGHHANHRYVHFSQFLVVTGVTHFVQEMPHNYFIIFSLEFYTAEQNNIITEWSIDLQVPFQDGDLFPPG